MSILVLAEHDNKSVKKATLNTVAAARKLGVSRQHLHSLLARHALRGASAHAAEAEAIGSEQEEEPTRV